jgi:hypothetical protein
MPGRTGDMKSDFNKIMQSVLAILFVVMTIGSGYLFMAQADRIDRRLSAGEYRVPGKIARWHGSLPMEDELERMITKSKTAGDAEAERLYAAALQSLADRGDLPFRTPPVSSFLVWCTVCTAFGALALLILSRFVRHDALQSLMGIASGFMAWITVEHGLIVASRRLGIARRLDIIDGKLAGTRGEFVLLEYSWVFLFLVLLYLLFQEGVRCPLFLFLRRRFNLMRGAAATGRIDNYAPRVAFFYTSSIWTFYVILLLAFDEAIFGIHSWFAYVFFGICLVSTVYLLFRIVRLKSPGAILRYAIGVTLVLWSTVEFFIKWRMVSGMWADWGPASISLFSAALFLSVFVIIRQSRKRSAQRPASSGGGGGPFD